MRLQTLKPRIPSAGGRLTQVGRLRATERLRGRAAVERRERYLRMHPICGNCDKHDRTAASTVPDHTVPLWAGGADNLEANGNALCGECHDAKTECEARMRAAGGWLTTPCICGQHAPT